MKYDIRIGSRQHTPIHTAWPYSPISRLCLRRVATVTPPGAEVVTVLVWGCPDRGAMPPTAAEATCS